MQQLTDNMVLELSATKLKASKGDGEDSSERIDKVGDRNHNKGLQLLLPILLFFPSTLCVHVVSTTPFKFE